MRKTLNVGIAGYGAIGKVRHRYCDLHPNLQVIGICDIAFDDNEPLTEEIKKYQN